MKFLSKNLCLFWKAARVSAGIDQKELADLMGVSVQFVSAWERGLCCPPILKLKHLCKVLEIKQELLEAYASKAVAKEIQEFFKD